MKTTRKYVSILCFALCFVMLLASCNQLTMNGADVNKDSEDVSSKEITEENSKAEESKTDISMTEESKAEEGKMDEEPSKAELDYVTEMTEEMANAFLKFNERSETISEIMANEESEGYNYKDDYFALGNISGYTFCSISPYFGNCGANDECGQYVTPDYKFYFWDGAVSYKSRVNLYLYRNNTFVTFEDACDQGLIDPAEAYELMCAAGHSKFAKKLTEEEANWYKELAEKGYPIN